MLPIYFPCRTKDFKDFNLYWTLQLYWMLNLLQTGSRGNRGKHTWNNSLLTLVWFSTLLRWLRQLLSCTAPKIILKSIAMKLVTLYGRHTLCESTLPKSIALSLCGPDLSLQAGRRSVVGRFILLAQNGAPPTPANLAVADEFIVRKIKVFSSHYCSSGIPPGEINFPFFSPYSGWQKLITGFIMPFSSHTLRLFWPPMSPSFRL